MKMLMLLVLVALVAGGFCFTCPEWKGQYPYEKDCAKYYNCWNFTVFVHSCDPGLYFEAQKRICLNEEMVDCGTRPKLPVIYKPTPECPKPVGYFPVEGSCVKFYYCVGGRPYIHECPEGQRFNVKNAACDWDHLVPCIHEDKGGKNIKEHQDCPDPNGTYPHPNDKSKYISCNGGVPFEIACPSGLVYNEAKAYCDWP